MSTSHPQKGCCGPVSSCFWQTTLTSKWTVNEIYTYKSRKEKGKKCLWKMLMALFKNLPNQKILKLRYYFIASAHGKFSHNAEEIPLVSRSTCQPKKWQLPQLLKYQSNNGWRFRRLAMCPRPHVFYGHYFISFSHQIWEREMNSSIYKAGKVILREV